MEQKVRARQMLKEVKSLSTVELSYFLLWFVAMAALLAVTGFLSRTTDEAIRSQNTQVARNCLIFVAIFIGPSIYALVKTNAYKKKTFDQFTHLTDRELLDIIDSPKSKEWVEREILNRQRKGYVDPIARVKLRWWHLGKEKVQVLIEPQEQEIIEHFRLQKEWLDTLSSRPKLRAFYATAVAFPILTIWAVKEPTIMLSSWMGPVMLLSLFGPILPVVIVMIFAHRLARPQKQALDEFREGLSNDSLRLLIPFHQDFREVKRRAKLGDDDAKFRYFKAAKDKAEKRKSD